MIPQGWTKETHEGFDFLVSESGDFLPYNYANDTVKIARKQNGSNFYFGAWDNSDDVFGAVFTLRTERIDVQYDKHGNIILHSPKAGGIGKPTFKMGK